MGLRALSECEAVSEERIGLHGALPGHGVVVHDDDERFVLRVRAAASWC